MVPGFRADQVEANFKLSLSINHNIIRTKYAGQSDKAPVIDCSRAGFFKVMFITLRFYKIVCLQPKLVSIVAYCSFLYFHFG